MTQHEFQDKRGSGLTLGDMDRGDVTAHLLIVFGMLGNVTTVYIYTRSRELRHKKVFELILAAFDIYALFVVLPVVSIDLYEDDGISVYSIVTSSICAHSYYITILCRAPSAAMLPFITHSLSIHSLKNGACDL